MSDIKSMPSLVAGGALFGLLKRLGLCDDDLGRWRRRVVVIVAIVWLPLLLLSLAEGLAAGGTTMPFLHDVDTAVRYLVALPLLIFAEVLVHRRFPQAMARFRERGLVNGAQAAEFDRAIASTRRWIEAPGVEWLLLAFVYVVGVGGIWRNVSALEIDTWYAIAEHGRLIPRWPGYWMGLVSVPLFQFLLLRWYYRIALWWILMWRLSRLNLSFQPLHPDKAGGLGFLAQFALAFAPLLMAEGSMAAGWIAGQIFFSGAHLLQFKLDLVAAVVVSVALCAMVTFGGVLACYLYHISVQHLPAGTFLATFSQYGRVSDFVMALVKAALFGLTATLVATFKGLHTKGGPRGVADSVNEAVVLAFALVFVLNTILSALYTVIVPAVGNYR